MAFPQTIKSDSCTQVDITISVFFPQNLCQLTMIATNDYLLNEIRKKQNHLNFSHFVLCFFLCWHLVCQKIKKNGKNSERKYIKKSVD